jgi:hypothetical protein
MNTFNMNTFNMSVPNMVQINYLNGDSYYGQVWPVAVGSMPHGYGRMINASTGLTYTGYWHQAVWNGYGELQYANGDAYKGDFCQGRKHGNGESYTAASQRRYKGQFVNEVEEGLGEITAPNVNGGQGQRIYRGYMHNGLRHGQGSLWLLDPYGQPTKFEGQWANGVLNGYGKIETKLQHLSGNLINGNLEGSGTEKDITTGKTYNVLFQGGRIVQRTSVYVGW